MQAALTAITGVVSSLLIQSENQVFVPFLLGAVLILSCISLIVITYNWRNAMVDGKMYSELRRIHLGAIERLWEIGKVGLAIDDVGLASVELRYRDHIKENKKGIFCLFSGIDDLDEFKMDTGKRLKNWTVLSQGKMFLVWFGISVVFLICGIYQIYLGIRNLKLIACLT
jgi:hypothetical protein